MEEEFQVRVKAAGGNIAVCSDTVENRPEREVVLMWVGSVKA